MASPLIGVAAVNSLLFTSFALSKRLLSPYPDLAVWQVGVAGGMAGGVNALLASPVEMFKVSSLPLSFFSDLELCGL
jgi:solute carrier family 25 carnitine/acylcarnitine transporter 20/29